MSNYGKFSNYLEARSTMQNASREEHESFVKSFWPKAFIYQHGNEWTVVPMGWQDRNALKNSNPEEAAKIPNTLSITKIWKTWVTKYDYDLKKYVPLDQEEFDRRDKYMWWLAVMTMIEHIRSKELEG